MSHSRQLAAIMFTDLVGFTALMGRDEQKALKSLALFKNIAQPLVEKFRGHWHKDLGDGALMSFNNVLDAVHCGIDIQKEINSKTDFRLRMGIHLGDVTFRDGDVFGDGVNISSRIQAEATPGGICISESVAKNINNQDNLKTEYLGKRNLKNVDEPVVLYQLLGEGLIVRSKKQSKSISLTTTLLLVIATAILTAVVAWQLLQPAEKEQQQVRRLNINLPTETPVEFIGSSPIGVGQTAIAVSPDGQLLIYVGPYKNTTALYARHLSSLQTKVLPGTEGAFYPFFSPDGKWIGFFAHNLLKKITLDQSAPTELCKASETLGACWTPNGKIIFANLDGTQLVSVDEAGGVPQDITPKDTVTGNYIINFSSPSILPDGNHILLWDIYFNIYIISLETNAQTQLPIRGLQPTYIPSGHITYIINGSMFAIPFDVDKMEITGKAHMVLDGIRTDAESFAHFTFDQKGNFIYAPGVSTNLSNLFWVDQTGKEDSLSFPPDYYGITSISPDGKKIAYTQTGVNSEVISLDLNTGRKTILNRTGHSLSVRWQADNKSLGFSSTYQSSQTTALKLFALSESTSQITPLYANADTLHGNFVIDDFSSDQLWAAFEVTPEDNGSDIWIKSLSDPAQPAIPLAQSKASEWGSRFSPNSQFIAYTSNASGRYEVYVQRFPEADKVIQISNGGGEEPVWTSTGREIIYRYGNQWWKVDVITEEGFIQPAAPKLLFEGPYLNCPGPSFDIAPDNRLLVLKPVTLQHSSTELVIIENWFEELKRLASAK